MRKAQDPNQDPVEGSRRIIDKQLKQDGGGMERLKQDAKGQFARSRHGADNDGVSSAEPSDLSGKKDGDATFRLVRTRENRASVFRGRWFGFSAARRGSG